MIQSLIKVVSININPLQGPVNGLDKQLESHLDTVLQVESIVGNQDTAAKHLGQCLYSVGMGSNDYLAYMNGQRRSQYTPQQYADNLLHQYSKQLRVTGTALLNFN